MKGPGAVIEQRGGDVLLRVRVQPKASREALAVTIDGQLRVSVTPPPVDGAANKAVEKLIAARLGLSRRQVVLESGEQSREKTLRIANAEMHDIAQCLGLDIS